VSNLQSPVEAVRETNREFGKDFFDWIQKTLASQTKLGVASGPVQGLELRGALLTGDTTIVFGERGGSRLG